MTNALRIEGTPAEIYEQHMVPAIFAVWAPLLIDAADVQPGNRVLDVACGTGAVTRRLAETVGAQGSVVGLDINPVMLAVARAAAARPNVSWHEGSALSLPLPAATFDRVVCQQGLQFFPDRPAALAEMRRVLKPGGRLALACWRSVEHISVYKRLEQVLAGIVGPEKAALPPFMLDDRETIRGLVAGAGLREVRIWVETHTVRFQSAEHLVRASVGGAPTMLGALAQQGPEAVDALVREFSEATRECTDDKGWAFPLVSHFVSARK